MAKYFPLPAEAAATSGVADADGGPTQSEPRLMPEENTAPARSQSHRVRLEVRAKLGVAYLRVWNVKKITLDDHLDVVMEDNDGGDKTRKNLLLRVKSRRSDRRHAFLRVAWPVDEYAADLSLFSRVWFQAADSQVVARLQLVSRLDAPTTLVPLPSNPTVQSYYKPWSVRLEWPRCLQGDLEELMLYRQHGMTLKRKIHCNTCYGAIGAGDVDDAIEIKRVIPLPSINWKEFSVDWFCRCSGDERCGLPAGRAKVKADLQKLERGNCVCDDCRKGVVPCSHRGYVEPVDSFEALSWKTIKPRADDVLFGPGIVTLNKDAISGMEVTTERLSDYNLFRMSLVRCSTCNAELGFMDNATVQLFDNAVGISSSCLWKQMHETAKKTGLGGSLGAAARRASALQTFTDILAGIYTECFPHKSVKMHFISPTAVLFVWIIDQDVHSFTGEGREWVRLHATPCLKVLFKALDPKDYKASLLNHPMSVDFRLTEELMVVGQSMLEENSEDTTKDGHTMSWLPIGKLNIALHTHTTKCDS